MAKNEFFKVPSPVLKAKEGRVMYPVSYEYNGGIVIDDKWYRGYKVGEPIVPKGFELRGLAIGLEFNNHPPLATMFLAKIKYKPTGNVNCVYCRDYELDEKKQHHCNKYNKRLRRGRVPGLWILPYSSMCRITRQDGKV